MPNTRTTKPGLNLSNPTGTGRHKKTHSGTQSREFTARGAVGIGTTNLVPNQGMSIPIRNVTSVSTGTCPDPE